MLSALDTANSPFDELQIQALQQGLAPLDAAQTAWLSGYLAGRLAAGSAASPDGHARLTPRPQARESTAILHILYASQTGNGQRIAESLSRRAAEAGVPARLQSLDSFRPASLRQLARVAIVVSTHGEGDAPDDALELFEYLEGQAAPDLSQLEFRILALGDSSYTHFCAAGRKLESLLTARGARPFAPRVECDLDYEAAAADWASDVLEHYGEVPVEPIPDPLHAEARGATRARLSVVPAPFEWNRQRPFKATVQRIQKITGPESDKDVHHVELSLAGSGIHYEPGDALGVRAPNPADLVHAILEGLQIDPATRIEHSGQVRRMDQWLTHDRELTRLTPATVAGFAALAGDEALARRFKSFDADGQRAFLERRQFVDLVQEFPAAVAPGDLLALLRPLAPRSYSIASSQQLVGEEVHLTIVTRYSNATGDRRRGLVSGVLNHDLKPGNLIGVFPEPNTRFRLPQDRNAPLILVAAGTGIAPFRAFLQQLEQEGSGPDIWLIFGNPHLRTDFLYQREWLHWRSQGLVSRIDGAFSRDQSQKRYVQHIVGEQASDIVSWLERGAHLYLCGGLDMGRAVERAVQDAFVRQRGLDATAAAGVVATLRREKRLLKDLY